VHELDVPDAALMRLFQSFEFSFQKVQPFDVTDDRGRSGRMRRFEIGSRKRAAQAVMGDHLIHPGQTLQVILVELVRFRRSQCGQYSGCVPAENGSIRHVGETCHRQ
jgi:hypothetical protein